MPETWTEQARMRARRWDNTNDVNRFQRLRPVFRAEDFLMRRRKPRRRRPPGPFVLKSQKAIIEDLFARRPFSPFKGRKARLLQ